MDTTAPHRPSMRAARRALALSALCSTLLLGSCATPVGVREVGFGPVFAERTASVLTNGELSPQSQQFLAALGFDAQYRSDPDKVLAEVEALALAQSRRGYFALLAEMHYARANAQGDPAGQLAAAHCAYLYLFCDELQPPPSAFDPRYRLSCEIYNRALAQALLEGSNRVGIRDRVIETSLGTVAITASRPGFPWGEETFSHFLPADAFLVRGLRERIRTPGLGVPLIAVGDDLASKQALDGEHMVARLRLPATAILEFEGGLDALRAGQIEASLQLHLAGESETVVVGEREVPLETDLTAPLAYTLEHSEVWSFSLRGFLGGDTQHFEPGVRLLQPYRPGKIPIVLVHGTASNPAVWAQLINGLTLDRDLRRRYQVWIALYNTGTPILYNAAQVRDALVGLVRDLDPEEADPALRRMVVVGHSQGGLLTRLLVTSSGDRFWAPLSTQPIDEYPLSDEDRELVRRCLFFGPLPFVERAVFVATPHRGSFLAGGWIGSIVRRMIGVPRQILAAGAEILHSDRLPVELRRGIPTSVENMQPDSHFVRTLAELPFAPRVRLNSIVAVQGEGAVEQGDDGVVSYSSAHLEEAESELVVRHGHSCQNEPRTILELRRILLEHVAQDPGDVGP